MSDKFAIYASVNVMALLSSKTYDKNEKQNKLNCRNIIKFDTPNTYIYDRSFSWLGTGTSIKNGGVKLVLHSQTSPLSEMMRLCK